MRERLHALDARRTDEAVAGRARDAFGRRVHAADGVDDPDLVPRSHAPVGAAVAVEARIGERRAGLLGRERICVRRPRPAIPAIVERAAEPRGEIVRVDPAAGSDRSRRRADRKAILPNRLPNVERAQRDLVPRRDVFGEREAQIVHIDRRAGRERAHGDRDVIVRRHTHDRRCIGRERARLRTPGRVGAAELQQGGAHAPAPSFAAGCAPACAAPSSL